MRSRSALPLALLAFTFASSAAASEEEIHAWRAVTFAAPTSLFGDVEVRAKGGAAGAVRGLEVVVRGRTIVVPEAFLASLPALPLASIELRSERGYDPEPWLYVVFHTAPRTVPGAVQVHLAFQGGKLRHATLTTFDGKGGSRREVRAAP